MSGSSPITPTTPEPCEAPQKPGKTIELEDGRKLGYAEWGDPEGEPLFYFHGWPGSRLEALTFCQQVTRYNLRLIGVDRPGMGLSDFYPKRRILDFPQDILHLADRLGLPEISVVGVSGGAPYALACAYQMPERLKSVGVISGAGPMDGRGRGRTLSFSLLRGLSCVTPGIIPFLVRNSIGRYARSQKDMERFLERLASFLPAPDRIAISQHALRAILAETIVDAFRQDPRGPCLDGYLLTQPWGFELAKVAFQPVQLFYGGKDSTIPPKMGRALARALPGSQFTLFPEEGHISLGLNHIQEIASRIMNGRRQASLA